MCCKGTKDLSHTYRLATTEKTLVEGALDGCSTLMLLC